MSASKGRYMCNISYILKNRNDIRNAYINELDGMAKTKEVMMMTFDPRNVQCPYCKKSKLRAIEDNERVVAYKCSGCGSTFYRDHFIDFERGIIYYLAKRYNPNYLDKLDSEDVFENLKKAEELDRTGVPFYTDTYVIGSKKFD